MSAPNNAITILDREFLEIRAKILELGAALDRLERADGSVAGDPRMAKVRAGIDALLAKGDDRAEQIQLAFSRAYDDQWQEKFFPAPK